MGDTSLAAADVETELKRRVEFLRRSAAWLRRSSVDLGVRAHAARCAVTPRKDKDILRHAMSHVPLRFKFEKDVRSTLRKGRPFAGQREELSLDEKHGAWVNLPQIRRVHISDDKCAPGREQGRGKRTVLSVARLGSVQVHMSYMPIMATATKQ